MSSVTLEDAQNRLPELIAALQSGDELTVTHDDRPVARIVPVGPGTVRRRQPGSAKGLLTILSEDDDHLRDFAEYM